MASSRPATELDDEETMLCESLNVGSASAKARSAARTSCVAHKANNSRPSKAGPAYVPSIRPAPELDKEETTACESLYVS
eukprot:56364-Eustigmatos_ZCMA.PRE.1